MKWFNSPPKEYLISMSVILLLIGVSIVTIASWQLFSLSTFSLPSVDIIRHEEISFETGTTVKGIVDYNFSIKLEIPAKIESYNQETLYLIRYTWPAHRPFIGLWRPLDLPKLMDELGLHEISLDNFTLTVGLWISSVRRKPMSLSDVLLTNESVKVGITTEKEGIIPSIDNLTTLARFYFINQSLTPRSITSVQTDNLQSPLEVLLFNIYKNYMAEVQIMQTLVDYRYPLLLPNNTEFEQSIRIGFVDSAPINSKYLNEPNKFGINVGGYYMPHTFVESRRLSIMGQTYLQPRFSGIFFNLKDSIPTMLKVDLTSTDTITLIFLVE